MALVWIFIGAIIYIILKALQNDDKQKMEDEQNEKNNNFQEFLGVYNDKIETLNIPKTAPTVCTTTPPHLTFDEHRSYWEDHKDAPIYVGKHNYFWKAGESICFFPCVKSQDDWDGNKKAGDLFCIPIEHINYFYVEGEKEQETVASGGGSSLKGAVLGGVLAGGVGAVIGSRKAIQSHTVTYDYRTVILSYFDDCEKQKELYFDFKAYHIFQTIIPEKAFDAVTAEKTMLANKNFKIADRMRQLKELKEQGILSEEEYENKKASILEQI